jgi:ATP-dependent Clp protease ATP-binding subunit ClpC
MQLANQEAQRFNHEYIGTEHIILGLLAEGSGVAANVLRNLVIDPRKIRRDVESIVQHGPGGEQVVTGRLPHTPRGKKVIEYAIDEARRLGHNYVGTEHILLGLLREEEGVAAQVLMNLGLEFHVVREEVLNLLGHGTPPGRVGPLPVVQEIAREPDPGSQPDPLSPVQLSLVRDLLRRLGEQKESLIIGQQVVEAARCRDEVEALARLLAWYQWAATAADAARRRRS